MKKIIAKYIQGRIKSFKHAFNGVAFLVRNERNAQIYIVATILVLLMSYWLQISANEWIAVCIVISLVFATEALNTAIEKLADFACNKEIHDSIKNIKDMGAAAVLFVAMGALVVGIIIFGPKLINL